MSEKRKGGGGTSAKKKNKNGIFIIKEGKFFSSLKIKPFGSRAKFQKGIKKVSGKGRRKEMEVRASSKVSCKRKTATFFFLFFFL